MNDQDKNMSRKRKATNVYDTNFLYSPLAGPRRFNSPTPTSISEDDLLNLTLGPPIPPPPPPPLQNYLFPQPPPNSFYMPQSPPPPSNNTTRPSRNRRASQTTRQGRREEKTITPPYQWATDKKAHIHTLEYLVSKQIYTITGQVQCKKCEKRYEMGFNLEEKFGDVAKFIIENKTGMHERAPECWSNPVLLTCKFCEAENSVKPVIAGKKRSINWLFLLLGQMLGCCTLEQLKYFCKQTMNHRTGAKDRVLYLAYLCVCKQLQPTGPFDRW
ncbi:hypothetical protein Leryth_014100 [Lithospermum erythrorhizon]|nr:hypothetical protein Leryth_014100 [Lithospermum erythrorhizon]